MAHNPQSWRGYYNRREEPYYGVPSVSKALTNAVFVYLPLIYKYDTDLAKYLPDLGDCSSYNTIVLCVCMYVLLRWVWQIN